MPKIMPIFILALSCVSCGSTSSSSEAKPGPSFEGKTFSEHGLTISRPEGWVFIQPDSSVGPDTVLLMQGPIGDATLAPTVEISRRTLTASQQRRKPSHILTQMTTEIVQYFDGFEMIGAPEDLKLGGVDASQLSLKYTETLPDGEAVPRLGKFFGIVRGQYIWVIRCMGSPDGSNDGDFDKVLATVSFS